MCTSPHRLRKSAHEHSCGFELLEVIGTLGLMTSPGAPAPEAREGHQVAEEEALPKANPASNSFRSWYLVALLTAWGIAVSVYGITKVDPGNSDALGLISAMPPEYFAGMAVLICAFVYVLSREQLNRAVLTFQIIAITVLLFGVAPAVEDIARLPTTWVHVGFIDYIQRTGDLRENFDARFAWPGFFTAVALLNQFADRDFQPIVYEWTPVVSSVLYLLPVWLIARGAGAPIRAAWLATLLFTLTNWVGQDYFSPQGLNYLFALSFIAVMLNVFAKKSDLFAESVTNRLGPRLRAFVKKFRPGIPTIAEVSARDRVLLLLMLAVIFLASITSHQLTPFFLIVITVALILLNRLSLRVLPAFMLLTVFMWITYAATSFWSGSTDSIFGDVGKVGGVVSENVSSRVTGDPDHLPVIHGRLALTLFVWGLAFVGVLRRLRKGYIDLICLAGFIAPFSVLGGQAYGGEAMLRVYLFALPFSIALAAQAFVADDEAWKKKRTFVVALVAVLLMPAFFITRHGNEAFEHFNKAEFELVNRTYTSAPPGSVIATLNSLVPTRGKDIEDYHFDSVAEDGPPADQVKALDDVVKAAEGQHVFFVVTRAQREYASLTHGQADDWADRYIDNLIASGRYRLFMENSDGKVLVPVGQQ